MVGNINEIIQPFIFRFYFEKNSFSCKEEEKMHFYFYFLLKLNRNTEKSRVVTNFQGLKFTHNLLLPVTKISFVLVVTALSYLKSCPCTTILYYSKSCQGITLTKSSKKYGTGCLFFQWFPLNFPSTKILYNLLASFNVIRLPCSCLWLLCVALCCI